jgi:hypothetical protein
VERITSTRREDHGLTVVALSMGLRGGGDCAVRFLDARWGMSTSSDQKKIRTFSKDGNSACALTSGRRRTVSHESWGGSSGWDLTCERGRTQSHGIGVEPGPSLPHWRECKLKPAPIFVLVD